MKTDLKYLALILILISCNDENEFSPENLDKILSLSIENNNAISDGIEEIKVIANFPADFITETDGKVDFIIYKKNLEMHTESIELIQENGIQKRQASVLIKHTNEESIKVKATISVNNILISKELFVTFSKVSLDDYLSLSVENNNALSDGIEEIKITANLPIDFDSEDDGKVEFVINKKNIEYYNESIILIQENKIQKRQAIILIKHNEEEPLKVKATISVNDIFISKEVSVNFSKAYLDAINVTSSTLTISPNSFNEIDIYTELLRNRGIVSLNTIVNTVVKDTIGIARGSFNKYKNKTNLEGKILNKYTLGNDEYQGKLFVISTTLDINNKIKSDTLTIYSQ
jgi:hypothetical protein